MALQQLNARPCAESDVPADVPPSGVTHIRYRHTERFTVVGNHLAQHRELSLMARGLALYIQSLPDGSKIGIKALAARFPEGEIAIAAALRELEKCGYLVRRRERGAGGRWVTRTFAYDNPVAADPDRTEAPAAQAAPPTPPVSLIPPAPPTPPVLAVSPIPPTPPVSPAPPAPPAPAALEASLPALEASLPAPEQPDLGRHRAAADLLAGLRRQDARLLLSARDVARLAPAVSAWLERGVEPVAVQRTLTAMLPQEPIRYPAAFLGHRLTTLLPPPLPAAPTAPRVDPLVNCDHCDRAYRAPEPGLCGPCAREANPGLEGD
ncbi:hypothetical protein [Streptomyces sp. NRRL F-5135]|uniref:hypothetical protein n=1 Tax=Streptomyces sp. NRRL F-5135 TaxID=1463858 RepID=UPI0004CC0D5F|nr:hypothetical protein [Streptomyces sp. NRRL F-5135]